MSAHTPGPWAVFDAGDCECPGIEADGVSIVVFGGELNDANVTGVQGQTVDEARANACLIAAAPDLLEALRDLLVRVADPEDYGPEHAITKARAAIAKATGVQA